MTPDRRGLYIAGEWVEAASGATYPVKNPATGEVLEVLPRAGKEEAEKAIAAAAGAFPAWSGLPARDRSVILLRMRDLMMERREDLARTITLEGGKPLKEALGEVAYAAEFVTVSAEECKRVGGETIPAARPGQRHWVIRQPVGVVGAITPWNFPAAMVMRKLAPALAAGCTAVLKPAEETPLTAIALFRILEEAGLPPGVANLVMGIPEEIGQALMDSPAVRKIAFTGSTAVGKLLMRAAAEGIKKLTLELGGHAPFIVFEDADIDAALEGLGVCKFRNAGQTCICPNRVYVHESVFDRFAEAFTARVQGLQVGNGLEEGVEIGPLISEEGLNKVEGHVRDALEKGAKVLCGGKRRAEGKLGMGFFFEPTVLVDLRQNMKILREETFGPVIPLIPFSDEDEVIRLANDTTYGLAAYVFTRDLSRSMRVSEALEFGIVGVNDARPAVPQAPFGGFKESGIGREGGRYGLEEFLETKLVSISL